MTAARKIINQDESKKMVNYTFSLDKYRRFPRVVGCEWFRIKIFLKDRTFIR